MAGKPKQKADVALLDKLDGVVFEQLAGGASLRDLCATHKVSMGSLHKWLTAPERAERYARARVERANSHAAKIEQLADDVEAGRIDPNAARVTFDIRKWAAAKLDPQTFGETKGGVTINLGAMHGDSLRKVQAVVTIDNQADDVTI